MALGPTPANTYVPIDQLIYHSHMYKHYVCTTNHTTRLVLFVTRSKLSDLHNHHCHHTQSLQCHTITLSPPFAIIMCILTQYFSQFSTLILIHSLTPYTWFWIWLMVSCPTWQLSYTPGTLQTFSQAVKHLGDHIASRTVDTSNGIQFHAALHTADPNI